MAWLIWSAPVAGPPWSSRWPPGPLHGADHLRSAQVVGHVGGPGLGHQRGPHLVPGLVGVHVRAPARRARLHEDLLHPHLVRGEVLQQPPRPRGGAWWGAGRASCWCAGRCPACRRARRVEGRRPPEALPDGARQVVTVATLLLYMARFPSMKVCPALARRPERGHPEAPDHVVLPLQGRLCAGVFRTACLPSGERKSPPKARVRITTCQ